MAWVQEIYDTLYDPNTVCVACISHGKDSLAMLRAIKHLGLPLHRIVTTDVWATQDIPAVLPEMWEWKTEADKIIKELYGIEVEHICAMQNGGCLRLGYQDLFYSGYESGSYVGNIHGFPNTKGAWCQKLKYEKVDIRRYILQTLQGEQEGRKEGRKEGNVYGFATRHNTYCQGELKVIRMDFQYPWDVDNGASASNLPTFPTAPCARGAR